MKSYERARKKKRARWKKKRGAFSDIIANLAEIRENFLRMKICCPTVNMKYNARVFLPESAKGTSEVTQNAQFILRGLIKIIIIILCKEQVLDILQKQN